MRTFFAELMTALTLTQITDHAGNPVDLEAAADRFIGWAREHHKEGGRLMFIGNGGSAAIASHMAIDWMKNGGLRTLSFNDGASLTCLGNDLGYESVFGHPIERHAIHEDILIAISSSGKSENILAGVRAASSRASKIVTLSGFEPNNPLRERGHLNFYVHSGDYGVVECAHLSILHGILNRAMRQ